VYVGMTNGFKIICPECGCEECLTDVGVARDPRGFSNVIEIYIICPVCGHNSKITK
jgi:C4-type Zn-finger protein